jgi:thiamine-monophosphate kinase
MLPDRTSEFRLIESFRAATGNSPQVLTGIGDDAAVVARPDGLVLLAADMLLEGVHFDLSNATPFQIGRKVLANSLQDCIPWPMNSTRSSLAETQIRGTAPSSST